MSKYFKMDMATLTRVFTRLAYGATIDDLQTTVLDNLPKCQREFCHK